MHQKTENNIKIIKLVNGDDIVAVVEFTKRQLDPKNKTINIERPLQIKYVPQITAAGFKDYIALIRWTNYTGDKIVTIPKDKIMTITNASNEMAGSYGEIIKNYDNLDKPKRDEIYQRKAFTDEENKKVNEIFKEFDDHEDEDEPTIH